MKRITGRAVAKVYAVTMALSALAAFVVYSQHKADTNAISSSKVMVAARFVDIASNTPQDLAGGTGTLTKADNGQLLLSGTKTYTGVTTLFSGVVAQILIGTSAVTYVENSQTNASSQKTYLPTSKSGRVFDPSQKIMPGSKSAAVFTPEPPRLTNALPVQQQQQQTR